MMQPVHGYHRRHCRRLHRSQRRHCRHGRRHRRFWPQPCDCNSLDVRIAIFQFYLVITFHLSNFSYQFS